MSGKTASRILAVVVALTAAFSPAWGAELKDKDKSRYGVTWWGHFDHAPFPAKGFSYKDDTIAVFVPSHFCPVLMRVVEKRKHGKSRTRFECYSEGEWKRLKGTRGVRVEKVTRVDYVVHFHGHSNTVAKTFRTHKLREQFSLSLQNAILVVPQGPVNAVDSAAGKLERSAGFSRMMGEVHKFLQGQGIVGRKQRIGRVIVTSHSGGYKAAAMAVSIGGMEVSELYLFDSLYGYTDIFFDWIKKGTQKGRRFVNVYFRDKPRARSKELMAMLRNAAVRFAKFRESEMVKPSFPRKRLTRERIIFIHTDLGHSECTRGNFNYRDYLFASGLRRVRSTSWFGKSGLDRLDLD